MILAVRLPSRTPEAGAGSELQDRYALLGEEGVSGEVLRKKREDSRPPTELACEGREGLPGLRKSEWGIWECEASENLRRAAKKGERIQNVF